MSYVVLARKYRPKNFAEMVGQEHVVTALGNALTTQRLHHAYLFTGTRGVGKTTVSRILAKSLNCVGPDGQGGITATPCGVCPACKDIDSGRFVDYTELDAASNRGVDEVQALLEQAVYKPVQGRFKVFMIDEVHMLTNTAFNAMLKTLEEPPDYLKFVLATTDPQKVPVTVLSRCLQFNLRPMAPETVFEHLGTVLQAEGVASEAPALRLLARAARGSMRDALSLTDQAIAFGGGQLQEEAVRQMLGSVGHAHVFALIEALAQGDGATVVLTIDGLRRQGLSAASTLEELTHVLQRMAVSQLTQAAPDPADPEAADVQRLAGLLPPDQTQLLYSLCLHGRAELGLAPDEYAALVMVLLRLLAFQPPGQRGAVAEKKSPDQAPLTRATSPSPPPMASDVAREATLADAAQISAPVVEAPVMGPVPMAASALTEVHSFAAVPVQALDAVPIPQSSALPAEHTVPVTQIQVGASPITPLTKLPVREVPPWEMDHDFSPEPVEIGTGQVTENFQKNKTLAQSDQAQVAPELMAVPVRQMPDITPITGALHRDAGQPVAVLPRIQSGHRTEEGDFWHHLVLEMVRAETVGALVRELALQSQLLARDASQSSGHWHLRVENASLNQLSTRDRLQNALAQHGHAVKLSIEVGPVADSPSRRLAAAAARQLRDAEETLQQDPFVQAMMREFGGKIVAGSIKPLAP